MNNVNNMSITKNCSRSSRMYYTRNFYHKTMLRLNNNEDAITVSFDNMKH